MPLADTNILLRQVQVNHPMHAAAVGAVAALRKAGHQLYVAPQNLVEFRCVATRPESVNGLGMSPEDADAELDRLDDLFATLPDGLLVHSQWRSLVARYGVCGVKVHDARLVAVMLVHGLEHILTFNTDDFKRYPFITALHPDAVVAAGGIPATPPSQTAGP